MQTTSPIRSASASALRLAPLLLVFTLLSLSSCTVRLVSPYDATTDQAVSALHTRVTAFVARMERSAGTPEGEYEANKSFYEESKAAIATIRLRAESVEHNSQTVAMIKLLDDSMEKLRQLHASGGKAGLSKPLAGPALSALDVQFKAILTLEIAKMRGTESSN